MSWTLEKDALFCEDFIEVATGEKRTVRASVTTYDSSGTYVSIKLFRKDDCGTFRQNQKITLSATEFEQLAEKYETIRGLEKTTELNQYKFQPKKTVNVAPKKAKFSRKEIQEEQCATQ